MVHRFPEPSGAAGGVDPGVLVLVPIDNNKFLAGLDFALLEVEFCSEDKAFLRFSPSLLLLLRLLVLSRSDFFKGLILVRSIGAVKLSLELGQFESGVLVSYCSLSEVPK